MANNNTGVSGKLELTVNTTAYRNLDLGAVTHTVNSGKGSFDQMVAELSDGTGSGQVNQFWSDERTLANGADDDFDLAGGLTSYIGDTITFTAVKVILIAIDAPDGTKSLRYGPQGVANALVAPFGDASDYKTVTRWELAVNETGAAGIAVTAGTGDIYPVRNRSGVSVTYRIAIWGEAT